MILSSDGILATAHHVVRGFEKIEASLTTGECVDARIISAEPGMDLAFLQIHVGRLLEAAPLAPGLVARAGASAIVVGNPRGWGQTAVSGVVGVSQNVRWDGNLARLQSMEAAITQGNSGGGVFDGRTGELLGVTVAKSAARRNIGYMVPIHDLLAILERKRLPIHELEDSREIYAEFGVRLRPVRLIDGPYRRGMLVTMVRTGSAAERAGWEVGDVLVGLDKYQVVDLSAFLFVAHSPQLQGGEVQFILARGDSTARGSLPLRRLDAQSDPVQQVVDESTVVAAGVEPVLAAGR